MRRGQRGVTTVEAAIVLPVFILVLIGLIEFGIVLHTNIILQNASREGARFGALGSSKTDIEQRVRDFAPELNSKSLTVDVKNAQGPKGTTLVVTTTYPVPVMTNMIRAITKSSGFTLTAETQMRLE
jgi:Flp pilus assembly protein TadG